jgi:hypothetical protein
MVRQLIVADGEVDSDAERGARSKRGRLLNEVAEIRMGWMGALSLIWCAEEVEAAKGLLFNTNVTGVYRAAHEAMRTRCPHFDERGMSLERVRAQAAGR